MDCIPTFPLHFSHWYQLVGVFLAQIGPLNISLKVHLLSEVVILAQGRDCGHNGLTSVGMCLAGIRDDLFAWFP